MKKLIISITIIISVITSSCLFPDHSELKMHNLTDKNFYVDWSPSYPDTVTFHFSFEANPGDLVEANSNTGINIMKYGDIHEFFDYDSRLLNDTLIIVLVDESVVKTYTEEDILSKQLYLQRYYLSHDDVMLLKSELYFPPIPVMSNMRMFPPYGTYNEDDF